MTGATGAQYRVVINPRHILECRGRVTIFADICGVNVRGIFASGVYAVMARRTITADVGVIEGRISPRIGCMAIFTRVAGGEVVG